MLEHADCAITPPRHANVMRTCCPTPVDRPLSWGRSLLIVCTVNLINVERLDTQLYVLHGFCAHTFIFHWYRLKKYVYILAERSLEE